MNEQLNTWEKIIDPNFINAELIGDVGAERTVTIKDYGLAETFNQKTGAKEQKKALYFNECKPMILNVTNTKTLMRIFPDCKTPSETIGRTIILYVASVKVGKNMTTGIRIKEAPTETCDNCLQPIKPTATHTVAEVVAHSQATFGGKYCMSCMKRLKENKEKTNAE